MSPEGSADLAVSDVRGRGGEIKWPIKAQSRAVMIPLGEMGAGIFCHLTVQPVIGGGQFFYFFIYFHPATGAPRVKSVQTPAD